MLRLITRAAFASVVFILTVLYGEMFVVVFGAGPEEASRVVYVSAVVLAAAATYSTFRRTGATQTVTTLIVGAALGAFLGVSMPTLSAITLLALLVVYDVVAVYRGPVGKIVGEANPEKLRGMSFTFREVQVGLGDLVFYSMLVSCMLLSYGVWAGVASSAGVLVGVYAGFRVVERRKVFPGLPFTLVFGLIAGFMAVFLCS